MSLLSLPLDADKCLGITFNIPLTDRGACYLLKAYDSSPAGVWYLPVQERDLLAIFTDKHGRTSLLVRWNVTFFTVNPFTCRAQMP